MATFTEYRSDTGPAVVHDLENSVLARSIRFAITVTPDPARTDPLVALFRLDARAHAATVVEQYMDDNGSGQLYLEHHLTDAALGLIQMHVYTEPVNAWNDQVDTAIFYEV